MGSADGPDGRPVQCSPGGQEGGLGCPDAFGCGLGECTGPGPQDGPVTRRPGDPLAPGLKFGVGVPWPGAGAGLGEASGRGAGWLLGRPAGRVAEDVRAVTDRGGVALGGGGAATVTCASC